MVSIRAVKAVAAAIAVAVTGAMLAASAPRASAAGVSVQEPVSPYAIFYQDSTGVMKGYMTGNGEINANGAMAPGSTPSTAPTPTNFQMVWEGTNHDLWSSGAGPTDLGLPMWAGGPNPGLVTRNTNPSLVTFPD